MTVIENADDREPTEPSSMEPENPVPEAEGPAETNQAGDEPTG